MDDRTQGKPDFAAFRAAVRKHANATFETPQHKRLFAVPITLERAQLWELQMSLWALNRRDCWAQAQALAPYDVKGLIWKHEEDELGGNAERGIEPHHWLMVRQGAMVNLTPEDFANVRMREGTRTCTYAWIHLARDSHWLKSVAACAALEISNSSDWVESGMSVLRGQRYEQDLGIPFAKQVNQVEHAEVDVEHADLLMQVAERHGTTQHALDLLLEGLIESWEIYAVWKGQLAEMMLALEPGQDPRRNDSPSLSR